MSDALQAMGINGPFLISQVVNFLILFGLLTVLIWKPARQRLADRREMLEQQRVDAEKAAEERRNIAEEREKVLEEARQEADQILARAHEQVDAIKKEARKEAESIRQKAREDAGEEKDLLLKDMREQIAPLATAAAQKLIGETLDEDRRRALLAEFFSGVKDGKVVVLSGKDVSGKSAEVVSALPLKEEEKTIMENELKSKMGEGSEVSFKVDESILGGVIIKIGDTVFNNSVAGQLKELRESLT